MKNPEIVLDVMNEILQDHIDYAALETKLYEFRVFLLGITELDLNDLEDRKDLEFKNGIALCTTFAALCTHDIMRTRQFIRGIYQAIEEKLDEGKKPVHIFYAGTGPFATLILPIITQFDTTEIRLSLMDVNESTLAYLDKVIDHLEFRDYIEEIVCADATTYQLENPNQIDILISETMQHGLVKEQQVPIMINLVKQLSETSIVIPNNIQLDLALKNSSVHFAFEDKHDLMYYKLTRLLDFTPEFIRSVDNHQKQFPLCEQVNFSNEKRGYDEMVVLTNIQVYKEEWILRDLSGLTIPKMLFKLDHENHQNEIDISYVIQEQPDFEFYLHS